METYKNDYNKEEDELLWELHEIRREIHKDFENKTIPQINDEALKKYLEWKGHFLKSKVQAPRA